MTKRTNQEWLTELRSSEQSQALEDLRVIVIRGLRYGIANRYDVPEADIEDFAQDALLKILKNLDTFRGESRFTTWANKIAYPLQILMWHEIVNATVGDLPVTVTFCPLCNTGIAFDRNFDGQVLDFGTTRDRILDQETGSEWNLLGQAVSGDLAGTQLQPIPSINHFWFSWAAFRPETSIYGAE